MDRTLELLPHLYKHTRSEYERMAEEGLFGDRHVELCYGVLVACSPQGSEHAHALRELTHLLVRALGDRARVQVQLPIIIDDESEPEPDLSVVPPGDYFDEQPRGALLVVEAALSSLRVDRNVKSRLYAEAAIPEYWLIDLRRRQLERYLAPQGGVYTTMTTHGHGEALALHAFPDVTVPLDAILPRP